MATITGSNTYSNSATVPSDGDVATAASLSTPMQTVLNNTRYLQQIVESSGVTTVRSVANAAALKALASVANGGIAVITTSGSPSLWRRNTAGTGSDTVVYLDHDTEAGGWDIVRPGYVWRSTGNYTDASAWATVIAGHNANTDWTDVTGMLVTVTGLLAGDIAEIRADMVLDRSDPVQRSSARLAVTENGGADIPLATTLRNIYSDTADVRYRDSVSMIARRTVGTSGTLVVKMQYKTSNVANTVSAMAPATILVDVFRP